MEGTGIASDTVAGSPVPRKVAIFSGGDGASDSHLLGVLDIDDIEEIVFSSWSPASAAPGADTWDRMWGARAR